MFDKDVFCATPFFFLENPMYATNDIPFCCWLTGSPTRESIQQLMLQGVKPAECARCYIQEAGCGMSRRTSNNVIIDQALDLDLSNVYDLCAQNNNGIVAYQLYVSPTCNATCVTCGPYHSTSWKKLLLTDNQPEEDVTALVNYRTAKYISFMGGEPFLSKHTYTMLEKLIECNNTDCRLSFVTNGSIVNPKIASLISAFEHVDICISIDGVSGMFEYTRYPLQWETVSSNVQKLQAIAKYTSVSFTVSNINILHYPETIAWLTSNNLRYTVNLVTYPAHFSIHALPLAVKQQILTKFAHNNVQFPAVDYLANHNEQCDELFSTACTSIAQQDQLKNISIVDYIPDVAAIFGGSPR